MRDGAMSVRSRLAFGIVLLLAAVWALSQVTGLPGNVSFRQTVERPAPGWPATVTYHLEERQDEQAASATLRFKAVSWEHWSLTVVQSQGSETAVDLFDLRPGTQRSYSRAAGGESHVVPGRRNDWFADADTADGDGSASRVPRLYMSPGVTSVAADRLPVASRLAERIPEVAARLGLQESQLAAIASAAPQCPPGRGACSRSPSDSVVDVIFVVAVRIPLVTEVRQGERVLTSLEATEATFGSMA